MSVLSYLKDKIVPLLFYVIALVLLAIALYVFKTPISVIVAICVLLTFVVFAMFAWDYLKRRRFYRDLASAMENNNETYYLTELIERPSFVEGQLIYDALEKAAKDMNDRIADYRLGSEEYREYIETWIHEVKTPIAAARLTIANNEETLLPLANDIDRIEGYVEQALYYSRSTSVEKDYMLKSVHLDTLVKDVVKKHSRAMIEHGITPEFDNLDQKIYADPKWLDFIISQIVTNAIKYHRPKTESFTPKILFSAERVSTGFETDTVVLKIWDNGIGIPAADTSRVFEKGFTGENGRLYAKSTGIGLYLSRKLCTKMKLRISLSSIENESTTVTLEFPLNKMYFLEA